MKVPSIKEIRKVALKKKYEPWITRNIYRPPATYLTWLLLHTNITANQVSFLTILIGFFSGFFFIFGKYEYSLVGAILFQLTYFVDCCDGDIARFRNACHPKGHYYGRLSHILIDSFVFLGIGIGLFKELGNIIYLYLVILITTSHMLFSVFVAEKFRIYYEYNLKQKKNESSLEKVNGVLLNIFKKIFDKIGIIFRQPMHFNIVMIAAIFNVLHWVIVLFAIFKPIITIGTFIYETQVRFERFE